MNNTDRRGGARQGSGRKKGGPYRPTTVHLDVATYEKVAELRAQGVPLTALVREAVEERYAAMKAGTLHIKK